MKGRAEIVELSKDTYTKAEVTELIKPLEKDVSDLKSVVAEANKVLETNKKLEKTNLENSIKLEMTKAGIDEKLFDLVNAENVDKAKEKISKIAELKKNQKVDESFKPKAKKTDADDYSTAQKAGDLTGMIKSKVSKLFE